MWSDTARDPDDETGAEHLPDGDFAVPTDDVPLPLDEFEDEFDPDIPGVEGGWHKDEPPFPGGMGLGGI